MSIKRKKALDIVSFSKGNVPRPKKESDDSSQPKTKTCQNKTDHFIPFAKYLTTPNYTSKKTDTRKIIFTSNLFAKYKIKLEIISLIDIKQHNKINKTEFILSNIISDEKNNAILFSFDFISKFFHSIVEQYYIIIVGLFIIKNNARDECEQTLQYFRIIKMHLKNIYDKSYKFIEYQSLIIAKNI